MRLLLLLLCLCSTGAFAQSSYTVEVRQPVSCYNGSDGVLVVHATGGVAPYQYNWFRFNGGSTPLGITDSIATGLSAGDYLIDVTDANGNPVYGATDLYQFEGPDPITVQTSSRNGCRGASNGTAVATVSGGTAPYRYLWSNGATTATVQGLAPGTYTLTVTDARQCTSTGHSVTIGQSATALSVTGTLQQPSGGCNGGISLSVSGGAAPYTYSWSNGAGTASLSGLCSGSYTVTVTDAAGCVVVKTFSFNVAFSAPLSLLAPISCSGGADGKLVVHASGGTSPYTFQYVDAGTGAAIGQTDSIATGLSAGSYFVRVTDANGNITTSNTLVLVAPAALALQLATTPACFATASGSATVSASGGTAPFQYLWNNGATTATATGLAAGTYTVTVTDARGCTRTGSVQVAQPAAALSVQVAGTAPQCAGFSNGTATATPSGGTAPYTYLWSNFNTGATATNLAAGTYSVTVTDAAGCSAMQSVTLADPAAVTAQVTTTMACFGGFNATATATVAGGTGPYQYFWSNGATGSSITGLGAGSYHLMVSDASGCGIAPLTFTVSQAASALAVQPATTPVSCFGGTNGTASVAASGGTAPYQYAWSNGATTNSLTGLAAGTYYVTVTDANQCSASRFVDVLQPAALALQMSATATLCFGSNNGTATVVATGGTAPYRYTWSTGATTSGITGLAAGTYSVTVLDARNCSATMSVAVSQPAASLAVQVSAIAVRCFGNSTGAATVTASGGTAPYRYLWSNGATSSNISGISAGAYTVTVTDANNCTATANITVSQPATALSATLTATPVGCFGGSDGSVTATPSGGTAPYQFLWNNGAGTSATATGLVAGTYSLIVTDANGCMTNHDVVITEPTQLAVQITVVPVSCFGGSNGSATAIATGGAAPYQFLWSNGATTATATGLLADSYVLAVTDARGCRIDGGALITQPTGLLATVTATNVSCFGGSNGSATAIATGGTAPYQYLWSNGATTASVAGLLAGSYNVRITDAQNCQTFRTVTVGQPTAPLTVQLSRVAVDCFGNLTGSAAATPSGGTPNYAYLWSTGAPTPSIGNLGPGTYSVTVTDAAGCSTASSIVVTQPTAALVVPVSVTPITCYTGGNGTASALPSGGTPSYSYLWSNGATTPTITNLGGGTYTVTVTDANLCTATRTVVFTDPPLLTAQVVPTDVSCFGNNSGTATATVSGGVAPYQYQWSTGATGSSLTNLGVGTYNVVITDALGCTTTASTTITGPSAPLALSFTAVHSQCFNSPQGQATATVTGGVSSYQFTWSNNVVYSNGYGFIFNLLGGVYSLTVTDGNGCTVSGSVTITEPPPLSLDITTVNGSCFGARNGSATATVSGSTPPYLVSAWLAPNSTNPTISNLGPGQYTYRVQDRCGVVIDRTVTITEPAVLAASTSITPASPCFGAANGAVSVVASGGTAPYQYLWSTGATSASVAGLVAGTYTVDITDAQNCTLQKTVVVGQPEFLRFELGPDRVLCAGQVLTPNATGNFPAGSSFQWTSTNGFSAATSQVVLNDPGTYYAVAVSPGGCTFRDTVTISRSPDVIASEFMVASQLFRGQPVTLVNITASPAPDSVAWILPPAPGTTILSLSQSMAELVFRDTGRYVLQMKAMRGACESISSKIVQVLEPQAFVDPIVTIDPLIRDFKVAPNPNNGYFTVHILLKEISPIRLRMINVTTNAVINNRQDAGSREYVLNYNLNLQAGMYVLVLETPKATRIYKVIVN
ncbi:hypothetical protein [Flaviaesturariibacter amylovorans]|uniref:PKD/Chitinase domain-containing protein n=1 Tax=Flaviaesturariibacter amylovorans TaxID=1084520 RepID=A0ABP8HMW5_9BACT